MLPRRCSDLRSVSLWKVRQRWHGAGTLRPGFLAPGLTARCPDQGARRLGACKRVSAHFSPHHSPQGPGHGTLYPRQGQLGVSPAHMNE